LDRGVCARFRTFSATWPSFRAGREATLSISVVPDDNRAEMFWLHSRPQDRFRGGLCCRGRIQEKRVCRGRQETTTKETQRQFEGEPGTWMMHVLAGRPCHRQAKPIRPNKRSVPRQLSSVDRICSPLKGISCMRRTSYRQTPGTHSPDTSHCVFTGTLAKSWLIRLTAAITRRTERGLLILLALSSLVSAVALNTGVAAAARNALHPTIRAAGGEVYPIMPRRGWAICSPIVNRS
jgi:hypothetical protein